MLFSEKEIRQNFMGAIFVSIIAALAIVFFPYLFMFFVSFCGCSVILGKGLLVAVYVTLFLSVGYSWCKYLWRRMG